MSTHSYSIAPSDMAFHALTTSLYKDRLRAPVREILSNAIDIQNRIGNKQPIEIKLPTPLDSQFRIRDFGSGLSKEDMLRLYSSLFSSDKHLARANEVGGFGVGAKSPFAYTDAFTVESFHNGTRTIYSAFMDGNRAPQLLELYQEITIEPNGLAVSYPIVKADEDALRKVVVQEIAICGHAVDCIGLSEPVVVLENNPKFEKIANAWLGNDASLLSVLGGQGSRLAPGYARMGNVVYPLRMNDGAVDLKAANAVLGFLTRGVREHYSHETAETPRKTWDTIIFELPIGSVRPAMSREELVINDDLTSAGLRQAHIELLSALYKQTLDSGDAEDCEKLLYVHEYFFMDNSNDRPAHQYIRHLMHDYYEDSHYDAPYDKRQNHKKASEKGNAEAKGPSDTSISDALRPQYEELKTISALYLAQKKVWFDSALVLHPMMVEELSERFFKGGRSHTGMRSDRFFDDGHGQDIRVNMFFQGSVPADVYEERHQLKNIWTSRRASIMLIPFDDKNPSWASDFASMADFRDSSWVRRDKKGTFGNFDAFAQHPNTLALLQLLASTPEKNDSEVYRRAEYILLTAQSPENQQELLALAETNNKRITILDLARKRSTILQFDSLSTEPAEASVSLQRPLAANVPSVATKSQKAYFWDAQKGTVLEKILSDFPDYLMIVDEAAISRSGMTQVLRSWQLHFKNETFYMMTPTAMNKGQPMLSTAWVNKARALMRPENSPSIRLDWMLATSTLPVDHPVKNSSVTQYEEERDLLIDLKDFVDNYGIRPEHKVNTQPLDMFLQLKTSLQFEEDNAWEKAVLMRYPLLSQFIMDIRTNEAIPYRSYQKTRLYLVHAMTSYVELVDKISPVFPPEFLVRRNQNSSYSNAPLNSTSC